MIGKFQSKLATWFGAYYDPELGKDVWPHYAVKNAIRRTFIFIFILINLTTWFMGGGEGLNTGFLPTGLSTTRAIIILAIMLRLYPTGVELMGQAFDRIPVTVYREDMTERDEDEEDSTLLGYVEKKYEEDEVDTK